MLGVTAVHWVVACSAVRSEGRVIRYPAGMRVITARQCNRWERLLLLALCLVAPLALAKQIIPAGGKTVLVNGVFNLACTDLNVGGVLDTGTGSYVNVNNLTVAQTGIIQGTGTIGYSGTLSVSGTVQPGVKLVVNPQTNVACPGPAPPTEQADVHPTPALSDAMLVALATLLLLFAFFALPRHPPAQRSRDGKGIRK